MVSEPGAGPREGTGLCTVHDWFISIKLRTLLWLNWNSLIWANRNSISKRPYFLCFAFGAGYAVGKPCFVSSHCSISGETMVFTFSFQQLVFPTCWNPHATVILLIFQGLALVGINHFLLPDSLFTHYPWSLSCLFCNNSCTSASLTMFSVLWESMHLHMCLLFVISCPTGSCVFTKTNMSCEVSNIIIPILHMRKVPRSRPHSWWGKGPRSRQCRAPALPTAPYWLSQEEPNYCMNQTWSASLTLFWRWSIVCIPDIWRW